MKCIQCGTDNKLKDRTANLGRCTKCQHQFAFEPTSMGDIKITDPLFAKAISDLSVNHTLFFTTKQFLYFLDARFKSKSRSGFLWFIPYLIFQLFTFWLILPLGLNLILIYNCFRASESTKNNHKNRRLQSRFIQMYGSIFIIDAIIYLLLNGLFIIFAFGVIVGMLTIYLGFRQLNRTDVIQELLIEQNVFQDWGTRWTQINGNILKLLHPPREEIAPATVHPDVTAYSFDRLVVCDSAAITQLLIANNFHFENNCAILSITGYPQSIFDTTMQMVRRNPDLQVYVLHDCSPRGMHLVHHLQTSPQWFLNNNVAIIDVGLLPRQIIATKRGMFIRYSEATAQEAKQLPPEVRQGLSAEELQWLEAGNYVELESITPKRLIRVLQREIAGSRDLEADNSGLIIIGDSGSDMYAMESFG